MIHKANDGEKNIPHFECFERTQAAQLFAPYGAVRHSSGTMPTTYNFTGQRLDSETGLLYYNFRYYDPISGRFVRADTVDTNAGGMDPYAYVGDSPENKADPTGHDGSWWQTALTITAIAVVVVVVVVVAAAATAAGVAATTVAADGAVVAGAAATTAVVGAVAETEADNVVATAAETTAETTSTATEAATTDVTTETPSSTADEGCPMSFRSTTSVETDHGEQAIGTLKVGEQVLAYNQQTHQMEYEPILHVWINHDKDLVDLTITTKTHAPCSTQVTKTSEVIHTNQKHPFFTKEKGFVPVAQLKLGMHILQADGQYGVITGWEVVSGSAVMYNLEVAHDHTFTVGMGEWVVHNTGIGCGYTTKYIDRNGVERWARVDNASADLKNQLAPDTSRIEQGVQYSQYQHDGIVFRNQEGILPDQLYGYYREWVVPTLGENGPGTQRIITGGVLSDGRYEEMYYTAWHYMLSYFKLY